MGLPGRVNEAVALVDDVLLVKGIGINPEDLAAIRADHADLTARRVARGKKDSHGE